MNKQYFLLIIIMISMLSLNAITYETASFRGFMYGTEENCEYDDWISHIAKGVAVQNYNLYAPFYRQTNGFGDFKIATTQELNNWNDVVVAFIDGFYQEAQDLIDLYEFPYKVVQFTDTDTGRVYYMLRENLDMSFFDDQGTPETTDDVHGAFAYGWGLYVVWPESVQPILVNVVHPNDDFIVPPLAVKAFQDWEAKYFMIAGAGREVKWTNVNPYWNSKSTSDPSRVAAHPFNKVYNAACNEIRLTFNRREFSPQLHSYDWNRHEGHANLQISAGPGSLHPNLPIRDLSSRKMDIVNRTDYLVIPENTVGIHEPVYTNDFYAIYYDPTEEPFYFDDGENYFPVNNSLTLPGYTQSIQYLYTNQGMNKYDVFDNFFHIEYDELPNCYPQNVNNYYWFYGYDLSTNTFNMSQRYDRALEYYGPSIELMKDVLFEALILDDGLVPDTPQNFALLSQEYSRVTLGWDFIDQYDFMYYEIHYSQSSDFENFSIHNRTSDIRLASPKTTMTSISNLSSGSTYYFKLRAKDYNDNYSDFSPTLQINLGSANISNYRTRSLDAKTYLSWTATFQYTVLGYRVYRSQEGQAYTMIADWESNPELLRTGNSQSFSFIDNSVENFINYAYKIAMVDDDLNEIIFHQEGISSPRPTHAIVLENNVGTIQDTLWVGNSPFATDGQDTFYDVVKTGTLPPQYVQIIAYEQTWNNNNGVSLSRQIHGDYNVLNDFKRFRVRVRSNQNNLRIRLANTDNRNTEKLILVEQSNNQYANLTEEDYTFSVSNTNYKDFWLYVGNVQPVVSISGAMNRLFKAGDNLNYSISSTYPALLDHYKVSIISPNDSLLVNGHLNYTSSSQSFSIPDNITIHDANLVVDAYCIDGEVIRTLSTWKLGIIPAMTTISYNEGINFVAHPFTANTFDLSSLIPDADLFKYEANAWVEESEIAFGNGFFLNTPQVFSEVYNYNIQRNFYNKVLHYGWNFLPNPHLRTFNIKDLDFILNNNAYTYGELYQQNILMSDVRVVRDGEYIETKIIYPGESFFIFVNVNNTDEITAQFMPYKNNLPIDSSPYTWQGFLTAQSLTNNSIKDEVILSCAKNIAENRMLIKFKQPEPVALPDNMSFYMFENTTSQVKFNRLSTNILSSTQPDYVEYPFSLELPNLDSFKLTASYPESTLDYQIVLVIGENQYPFTSNTELIINPEETLITGYIRIVNEFLTNESDVAVTPLSFSVYPNPFNPTTNISFSINKSTRVSVVVYNVKGQRVKTLNDSVLEKGNHILSWNGKDNNNKTCASGIYFISVVPEGYNRQIKKVSLIK